MRAAQRAALGMLVVWTEAIRHVSDRYARRYSDDGIGFEAARRACTEQQADTAPPALLLLPERITIPWACYWFPQLTDCSPTALVVPITPHGRRARSPESQRHQLDRDQVSLSRQPRCNTRPRKTSATTLQESIYPPKLWPAAPETVHIAPVGLNCSPTSLFLTLCTLSAPHSALAGHDWSCVL